MMATSVGLGRAMRRAHSSGWRLSWVLPSARELGERHHLRVFELAQALHVEHDDLLQVRRALAHGQDLVELLLVLHEQELGLAVVDEILDLGGRVGRIDAGGDAGRAQHAEVAEQPLLVVVGEDGHRVAGLEPERHQPHADGARIVPVARASCRPSRCRGPFRAWPSCRAASPTRCQNRDGTVLWPSTVMGVGLRTYPSRRSRAPTASAWCASSASCRARRFPSVPGRTRARPRSRSAWRTRLPARCGPSPEHSRSARS